MTLFTQLPLQIAPPNYLPNVNKTKSDTSIAAVGQLLLLQTLANQWPLDDDEWWCDYFFGYTDPRLGGFR